MDDKIIGNVYETFDYGRFRILLGNRNIPSIEKISKSIDDVGCLVIPIIVNEKYEIIDGQTRYTAWKERNLPIYYIVREGYGMHECIVKLGVLLPEAVKCSRRNFLRTAVLTRAAKAIFSAPWSSPAAVSMKRLLRC